MIATQERLEQLLNNTKVSYNGKNLEADCPICGQHEFAISLVKENNPFNCYRKKKCGWSGNIYDLLNHFGETLPTTPIDISQKMQPIQEKQEEEMLDLWLDTIPYPVGWKRIYTDPYLESRGWDKNVFERYEVGTMLLQRNRVYFAVHMNRKLVGYLGRATVKDMIPKYKNSVTDFRKALYGFDELWGHEVILVEGVLDKVAVDYKLGFPCVATFGAHVSDEQIELLKLKGIKKVWLMHEVDVLSEVKKSANRLARHFETKVCYIPNDADPDEVSAEVLRDAVLGAKDPISFSLDYMKNGLQE